MAVQQSGTLTGFADDIGCEKGVAIAALEPGTGLTVRTANSQYHFTVIDGARHRVLVEGGNHFPEATPAVLQGSTKGGRLLKTGWIGEGLHVELSVGPRCIITSRVRSVTTDAARL